MDKLKILHYSFGLPPKATGGLPLYVRDLMDVQLKYGHIVNILLPKQRLFGKDAILRNNGVYYLNNSLPVPSIFGLKNPNDYMRKYNTDVIKRFLDKLNPDIIHIHTFMGLPAEFLVVAKKKKIKLIYTTHDYYGLCLKCNFIDSNGSICKNKDSKKCAKCNLNNGLNTEITYFIGSDFYKIMKKNKLVNKIKTKYRIRNTKVGEHNNFITQTVSNEQISKFSELQDYYYSMFNLIDSFHFNSSLTQNIYKKHLNNIKGDVIPITLNHIKDNRYSLCRKRKEVTTYGYIGRNEPYKGIDFLIEVLSQLDKENFDFNCYLYGDDFTRFEKCCSGKIKNMGIYNSSELKNIFEKIDILIVPSICFETFGFVVLEALSYGVTVLASEHVGAKDLLDSKSIFSLDSVEDLKNILIDLSMNFESIQTQRTKKAINFDINIHMDEIVKFYR